jgi:hypothetical protein
MRLFCDVATINSNNSCYSLSNLEPSTAGEALVGWERIVTHEASAVSALLALNVAFFNEQEATIAVSLLMQADTDLLSGNYSV